MAIVFHVCQNDKDRADYTRYFIKHRAEFNSSFSLGETLLHILQTLGQSHIMIIRNEQEQIIGWMHFNYLNSDYQPDRHGAIAFVDSAIVDEKYRSSRLFLKGLRQLTRHMAAENPHLNRFEFRTPASNRYLNRLYAKFATVIGQIEGYQEIENVYSTHFSHLLLYLNGTKNDN